MSVKGIGAVAGPFTRYIPNRTIPLIGGWQSASGSNRLPFFVNPRAPSATDIGGNDGRDGLSVETAFLTLQGAIDKCVDDVGDRIIVLRGTHDVTAAGPVLFNKKGIIVQTCDIGYNSWSRGERFNVNHDSGVAAIISQPCRIMGLGFQGGSATKASVQFANGSGFTGNWIHLYQCRFTNWNNAKYGVSGGQDGAGNDYCTLEKCDFDGSINGVTGGANTFDSGVHFTQGHYMKILGCRFRGCSYAITHAGQAPNSAPEHWNQEFEYSHNKVLDGLKFLDAGDTGVMTTQKGLLADNWFGTAKDAATNSATIATLTGIGCFLSGNHYLET